MHDGPLTGSLCVAVSSPQSETEARVPSLPFLLGGGGCGYTYASLQAAQTTVRGLRSGRQ